MDKGFIHRKYGKDAAYAVFQAYIASTLAGDEKGRAQARDLIKDCQWPEGSEFKAIYEYLGGKLTREEALKMAEDSPGDNRVNLCWVYGSEAESTGKTDEALEWYKRGLESVMNRRRYPGIFMKNRLAHFGQPWCEEGDGSP